MNPLRFLVLPPTSLNHSRLFFMPTQASKKYQQCGLELIGRCHRGLNLWKWVIRPIKNDIFFHINETLEKRKCYPELFLCCEQ